MGTPLRGALKGGRSLRSTAYVLNRLDAICAIYGPAKRIVLAMLEYFGHRGFYADKEPVHGFVLLARAPLQLKLHPLGISLGACGSVGDGPRRAGTVAFSMLEVTNPNMGRPTSPRSGASSVLKTQIFIFGGMPSITR